jgi:hypothetical protein
MVNLIERFDWFQSGRINQLEFHPVSIENRFTIVVIDSNSQSGQCHSIGFQSTPITQLDSHPISIANRLTILAIDSNRESDP